MIFFTMNRPAKVGRNHTVFWHVLERARHSRQKSPYWRSGAALARRRRQLRSICSGVRAVKMAEVGTPALLDCTGIADEVLLPTSPLCF